jgi:hypothetical protein
MLLISLSRYNSQNNLYYWNMQAEGPVMEEKKQGIK